MKKMTLCVLVLALLYGSVFADRQDPVKIKPIPYKKYLITAPNTANYMGEIVILDKKTKKKVWSKKIYDVKYNPQIEGDVQAVYFKKMSLKKNVLTLVNERDYVYELNLDTRVVKVIKGEPVIYLQL